MTPSTFTGRLTEGAPADLDRLAAAGQRHYAMNVLPLPTVLPGRPGNWAGWVPAAEVQLPPMPPASETHPLGAQRAATSNRS